MSNKLNTVQRPIKSMFVASSIALASGLVAMMASSASAAKFGFGNILGGDTVGDSYNGNYSFEVFDVSQNPQNASQVLFKFFNSPGAGSITQISWDFSNSLLSNAQISSEFPDANVNFSVEPSPKNFPQGNIIGFTPDLQVSANSGPPGVSANGVGGGESLGVRFTFTGNYNQVLNALNTGDLRLGIHVQSLPNGGGSDSYVSQAVPEPLTILGALTAVGFGAAFKRRTTKTED